MKDDAGHVSISAATDALVEALADLVCPHCAGEDWLDDGRLDGSFHCQHCGHRFDARPGLIHFGEHGQFHGLSQRLMRSRPVVSIYESAWRPAITWAASGVSYAEEIAFLSRHLPDDPSSRIVDWCCGTGLHGRTLVTRLRKPGLLIGVDASLPMAQTAAARAQSDGRHRQVIIHADMCDVTPHRPFTAGYCFAAFHLLEDQAKALAHMARSLAVGAPFLCFTLYRPDARRTHGLADRVGIRTQAKDDLLALFAGAGLEVGEVRESGRAVMIQSCRV